METIESKEELLRRIREARAALEETLLPLDEAQMVAPLLDDGSSAKDTMAHISEWEQLMVRWIEESLRGETPQRPVEADDWVDELNAQLYAENKDKPLDAVQRIFSASYEQVLPAVEALSTEELFDPDHFAWREGHPLWHLVGGNTFWHYDEHREAIEQQLL
jgi:hypothetical protein